MDYLKKLEINLKMRDEKIAKIEINQTKNKITKNIKVDSYSKKINIGLIK